MVIAIATLVGFQTNFAGATPLAAGERNAGFQAQAPPDDKRLELTLDGSAVKSRLVVVNAGSGNDAKKVVVLGRPAGMQDIPDYSPPSRVDIFPRELVRQALLIAARDELGLATRDEVIDDTAPGAPAEGTVAWQVASFVRDNHSYEIIRRETKDQTQNISSHVTRLAPGRNLELLKLLASAEVLSREMFPDVLKGLGLAGQRNAIKDDGGLPEKVDDRLASLDFVDALLAVRDLHRAIRADGESPARVGALARGYALLGALSEFQWHPAHKAFKTRALLYAQRLLARSPDRADALWSRAFALALFGRHGDALVDLETAKKKGEKAGSPPVPEWVDLVDSFGRHDSAKLARVQGAQKKLAAFLRMVTVAFPRRTNVGLRAASDVVLLQPYCFRAHDTMSEFFGVATQHVTSMIGPQALEHFLTTRIPEVSELPKSVKDHLDANQTSVQTAALFYKAGEPAADPDEPCWGALGHMIRETRFVQVFRQLNFMKYMLSVPAGEAWNQARAQVAGHRYAPFLESMALSGQDATQRLLRFAEAVDLLDIETTESAMNRALWALNTTRSKAAWSIAMAHEDETAELAITLSQTAEENKAEYAREILKFSPYHGFARATLIDKDWNAVKGQVAAWEKESGDSPAVLAALGRHYSAAKIYDDAQRALSRYIELSPDVWAYEMLAANFKAQGNIDRWKSTLDEFLQKEDDPGLDHAKVRVEIANYFMERQEWEKARPYAEDAAMTWAEWAMQCAARCAEGEKAWDRAEAWFSRTTERYPDNSWAVWYLFCKRTGQGNLDAARDFVDRYIAARANRPDLLYPEYSACFYWFDGRTEKAKQDFRRAFEKYASVSAALCLALLADDEKDTAKRDAILNEFLTKNANKAPRSAAITRLLVESILSPNGKKPIDLAQLDRLVESVPDDGKGFAYFLAGWFLKNHGDADAAKKYLGRCAEFPKALIWYRYLCDAAIKRGLPK